MSITMAEQTATIRLGTQQRQFLFRAGSSDEHSLRQIFREQHYSLNRLRRAADLASYVRRHEARGLAPLIVDAGAYIGASAVYFLAQLARARVVAIEPDHGNFELLAKNVAGLDVELMHAAVASAPGHARVTDPGEGYWGLRTEATPGADSMDGIIPAVTINHVYEAHAAGCFPFIVKLDIEGAEKDVFSANTEWVARTPLIILELHDWLMPGQGCATPFLRCISALDRDFVFIGENVYSIANDLDALGG
jgi:FkbM family methyltransferase